MLIEGNTPVIDKLNVIHQAGTTALRAGTVEPFKGYGEDLRNRFNVSIRYTLAYDQLIRQRILNNVTGVAQQLGIDFMIAGKHSSDSYPLHTTLLEGLYLKEDSTTPISRLVKDGDDPFHFFKSYMDLDMISHSNIWDIFLPFLRCDRKLKFDSVLIDKGPILLAATEIPQEIIDIRGALSEIYSLYGLKTLPLNNLLHITLARMTKVVDQSNVEEYIYKMEQIHKQIVNDPLELSPYGLYTGNSLTLLTSHAYLYS